MVGVGAECAERKYGADGVFNDKRTTLEQGQLRNNLSESSVSIIKQELDTNDLSPNHAIPEQDSFVNAHP